MHNWKQKKLNDVCDKISLNKIKIKQKDYLFKGKYPVIDQGQDLIGGYYNNEDLLVPNDPPYIIFGDHTKVKKFIPFRFIAGADGVKVLKAKNNILPKFLYYLLHTIKIENKGYARHFQLLEKETFLIPEDIPEQRAIVKKLESLFSSLDAGVADLKKAQQQLKIYRQAVLKKAFDSNAEFFRIGECFSFLGGGTPSKQNKGYWNGNINWASIKDIKGDILNNTIDYITEDGLKNSSSNLAEKNEVILATRINPGKTIISNIRTAINQDLKVIKPFYKCDYKYIHYLFKSIEHKCLKVSSGTTVLGISLANLKEIEIPFEKDIQQQAKIVKEIESRLSVCDSIEQNIKESLEKAEALRQSILKKAFEGNLLTAQELAECKLAKDYEPAGVLLEKMKMSKK